MSNYGPAQFGPAVFGGEPVPHLFLQIDAEMTTLARRYTARGHTDGTSLRCTDFAVGQGGFDPLDYLAAIPVNPDVFNIVDQVFTDTIDYIEWANSRSVSFYCFIDTNEAAGAYLGEIGIYAEIQNSPIVSENGNVLLYAVGHFPLVIKAPANPAVSGTQMVLRTTVVT